MKVEVNGTIGEITWKYTMAKKVIPNLGTRVVDRTICQIRDKDHKVVKTSHVDRYVHEPFNREAARKYSLEKLLNDCFPTRTFREVKKAYWDAYFNRKKDLVSTK